MVRAAAGVNVDGRSVTIGRRRMDELLRNLVLLFLSAGAVLHLFHFLRVPSVAGLLVAGVLIGPHGIGLVKDPAQISQLADLGIVLLMFSIGLDFTPERLRQLVRSSPMGLVQMGICIVVTAAVAILFVDRWAEAIFLGMLVSHTSSTLMMKVMMDRGEARTPQARMGLGISITQDLSVVPMLLAVPMMARGEWVPVEFAGELLRAALALLAATALARWVIPFWLNHVIRARNRELFLIFLTVIAFGMAWATTAAGLPASLGAFLAGMASAGSAYSHQTLAEVVPFRDLLVSLFFVSIGMLLNLGALGDYALPATAAIVGVLLLKFVSGLVPVALWRYPLRIGLLVGLAMAQIGEFAFVLVHAGREAGLISDVIFNLMVLVTVATMMVSPLLIASGPGLTRAVGSVGWLRRFDPGGGGAEPQAAPPERQNHVVIAGYGLNGRNLAAALRSLEVPHVAMDLDHEKVSQARRVGEEVIFGDCTRSDVLRRADLEQARVLVVAISDRDATRRAVQVARHENGAIQIIVRTKHVAEIGKLRELGADEVIDEEFETSLEILERALGSYRLPRPRIDEVIGSLRGEVYEGLRDDIAVKRRAALLGTLLPAVDFESVTLGAGSPALGRSVRELDLRARTGATLLAVERGGATITLPPADFRLDEEDVLVISGPPHALATAVRLLQQGDATAQPTGTPSRPVA